MKDKKIIIKIIMIILTTSIILSGCKNKAVQSVSIQSDESQYLNIALEEEPRTLDQFKLEDKYSHQVIMEVNEALTRIEKDENGNDVVKPAGAESWDISSDGLTWVFHLRDNEWSDGKKVTAKDYEYGIKRTLEPKSSSKHAFLLYPIKGARKYNNPEQHKANKLSSDILGVKAIGDNKLEIVLEAPCAYFINLTSTIGMQPQRKDIVEKYGERYGTEADMTVFSGPFIIKQWLHGNKIELVKNKGYWDAKSVKLQRVTMKFIKSYGTMLDEFGKKSLDVAKIMNLEARNDISKASNYDTIKVPIASINYEVFNQNNKLFSNRKVRKAFVLALDREEISKKLWGGVYAPAYSWISPSINIGNENFRQKSKSELVNELKEKESNPKALLIEGLKELGIDKDPSKITVTYLQPGLDRSQKDIAEFFKAMYNENLGINIKVEYVDWKDFQSKISSGDYEIASMTWNADYNDPMSELYIWSKDSNMVQTGWTNTNYDRLIGRAALLKSDENEERFNCFKEAEKVLILEDAVISPIMYKNKNMYKQQYVKGIEFPAFGPEIEFKYAYTQGR